VNAELHRGPLHAAHVEAGATLGAFGGWEMPISYPGGGVVAEHTAVREAVGVFDVTHLGKVVITGRGAMDFVNSCLTADLAKIGSGHVQYTLCCTEDGGVVDDLIAYLVDPDEVF
jgi:aminomethyltransferase